ncbi:MAG: hypothetical protein IH987_10960 [Planctomycetes bacterium]|nr:hypothetical protein [Planctomycetota bacterium]
MNASNSVKENGRVGSDLGLFKGLTRAIGIFLVASAAASSATLANDECFSVGTENCACEITPAVGTFRIGNGVIDYDVVFNSATCASVSGAKVVLAKPQDNCTPELDKMGNAVVLFSLGTCSQQGANARFVGQFTITNTSGSCATGDTAECLQDPRGIVERAVACAQKIIKDNMCPSSVVPTVSEWGLVAMIGLVMIAGTLVSRRRTVAR